ncbi:Tetratricopeptide repeat protein 33 [Nymphaea thermarum]|nr:Tetratricopeptide repeat protein 33 [Nymphaea thermarum]
MKMVWKKNDKKRAAPIKPTPASLPFDRAEEGGDGDACSSSSQTDAQNQIPESAPDESRIAESFESEGNKLAENGRYHEALSKWEAALTLMPDRAILHEEKAQVLLEIGEAWKALKAATRATELEPLWAEAWVTLGRAQLNFGEPEASIESFDKALSIKPDLEEVQSDRQTALHHVKKRKRLQIAGSDVVGHRYTVKDENQEGPLGD